MTIKAQYYFKNGGIWSLDIEDGSIVRIEKPELGQNIEYKGKTYEVVDIDVEYDVYDIYLD